MCLTKLRDCAKVDHNFINLYNGIDLNLLLDVDCGAARHNHNTVFPKHDFISRLNQRYCEGALRVNNYVRLVIVRLSSKHKTFV